MNVRVGKGVGGFEPIGKELGDGRAGTLNPNRRLRPRKDCADANTTDNINRVSIFILLKHNNCDSHFFNEETSLVQASQKRTQLYGTTNPMMLHSHRDLQR